MLVVSRIGDCMNVVPPTGDSNDLAVLDRGLPPLPSELAPDSDFPVARWAGPRFGAVLRVWREPSAEDLDEGDSEYDNDVQVFRRTAEGWEPSDGSGGSDWFDPPFERPEIGSSEVLISGQFSRFAPDWPCCAIYGVAGADARVVEVTDADGVMRTPVESPIGAFIVCSDARSSAVLRIYDGSGNLLLEETFVDIRSS